MNVGSGPLDLPVAEVLRRRQVRALFQPMISLDDGSVAGYEGLARVGPGEGGLPVAWLDAAEAIGLRTDLELLCLEVIAEAGSPPGSGTLFVNASVETAFDERIIDLREILADQLVIDLTERDALEDRDDLPSRLAPLTGSGVQLSIDDAGSASFLDLARLSPAYVKLDPRVVRGIEHDPTRQSLVASIVRFGRDVGFNVVAEGIERVEELEALRHAGVELGQGFLLGRPADPWQQPGRLASRAPATLDTEHGLRHRLRSAVTREEASQIVVDSLAANSTMLPSVYFERSGLLRCQAQHGYWQILDGIPTTTGIMARAYRTGQRILVTDAGADPEFLEALPGITAELVEPLRVGGRVIGVLNVESEAELEGDAVARVGRAARLLSDRLEQLGGSGDESPLARLARSAKELSGLSDAQDIERAVVRLACEVAGMSSAALFLPVEGEIDFGAAQGPLAAAFRELDRPAARTIAQQVGSVSSCYAGDQEGGTTLAGIAGLRRDGAATIAVLPMQLLGRGTGLLIVADHAPMHIATEHVEAIELLASEAARALDLAGLVAELRDRATRDPITGLQNQRAFDEALKSIGGRRSGKWAVLMADIDKFKAVNDTHGHLAGDRLLRELAASLNDAMRPMDRIYRVGGDEFAAILADLDAEGANEVGRRLCESAQRVLAPYDASLSIGIALPHLNESSEEFVSRADEMLYQAKRTEPGTVELSE